MVSATALGRICKVPYKAIMENRIHVSMQGTHVQFRAPWFYKRSELEQIVEQEDQISFNGWFLTFVKSAKVSYDKS